MVECLHHIRGSVQREKSIDLVLLGEDARLYYLRTKDVNGAADEQVRLGIYRFNLKVHFIYSGWLRSLCQNEPCERFRLPNS